MALGVGLVIGVERGWRRRDEPQGGRTAGVRTFALIGVLGGLMGALSSLAGSSLPWLAGLILLTGVFGVFSYREGAAARDFSVTAVVVAMAVFCLGVLASLGDIRVAGATGVVIAILLASREHLHRAIGRLTWVELRSALLLLAMTAVALPLLPNRAVDPWGALNPRELWLLMILTGAVSYAGYIALKIAGPRKGPPVAGLAGGLASSTATTLAMARLSRDASDGTSFVSGASLSAMVSLLRASGLALVLEPRLAGLLLPSAAAAAAVFGAGGLLGYLRGRGSPSEPLSHSVPFEAGAVFGFGLFLAGVMLVGAWISGFAGETGSYLFAAVTGLVDVDAITLSTARSVAHGVALATAAQAVLIAFAANAVQRAVIGWIFGSRPFAGGLSLITAAALAAGALTLAWTA